MSKPTSEQLRVDNVNLFIKEVADCGRRFFFNEINSRYASVYLDGRGIVWFTDDYTQERVYTHYSGRWRGFSHGGTLKGLVEFFRNHIKKGSLLRESYFDTSDMWCSGHSWGYPHQDYPKLKEAAIRLGLMAAQQKKEV